MRQLSMRAVDLAPLIEQGQDRLDLLSEQTMHRRPARSQVAQPTTLTSSEPTLRTPLGQVEHRARTTKCPPRSQGLVQRIEQAGLGGRIDSVRDPATQPQPPFPSTRVSFTASSLHASDSRATSALACSSS